MSEMQLNRRGTKEIRRQGSAGAPRRQCGGRGDQTCLVGRGVAFGLHVQPLWERIHVLGWKKQTDRGLAEFTAAGEPPGGRDSCSARTTSRGSSAAPAVDRTTCSRRRSCRCFPFNCR